MRACSAASLSGLKDEDATSRFVSHKKDDQIDLWLCGESVVTQRQS